MPEHFRPNRLKNRQTPLRFDPFTDRLARDIRNSLSIAFVGSLKHRDPGVLTAACRRWLDSDPEEIYGAYIESRQLALQHLFRQYAKNWDCDPLVQAVWLWNAGLFFEVHEILEDCWRHMSGNARNAFKALIQAAGCYIHWQAGHQTAAGSLADRAVAGLRASTRHLAAIANLDVLIYRLAQHDFRPLKIALSKPAARSRRL